MWTLKVYPQIDAFLRISIAIDTKLSVEEQAKQKETYIQRISGVKFLLLCYKATESTILRQIITGNAENFYFHILFYYFPMLVDHLWEIHQVGIGVFNLQGFERRNNESKTIAKRFYNSKHNVCYQTMNRAFNLCYFSA